MGGAEAGATAGRPERGRQFLCRRHSLSRYVSKTKKIHGLFQEGWLKGRGIVLPPTSQSVNSMKPRVSIFGHTRGEARGPPWHVQKYFHETRTQYFYNKESSTQKETKSYNSINSKEIKWVEVVWSGTLQHWQCCWWCNCTHLEQYPSGYRC